MEHRLRALIVGCGDVGTRVGLLLARPGVEVFGLRRDPSGLPAPLRPVAADVTQVETLTDLPAGLTHVAYTASADGRDEEAYRAAYVNGLRNVLDVLRGRDESPRLLFTGSTAVYGQDDGTWVDERSPTEPTRFTGRILLEAEALVHAWGGTSLRLAGIYGPGRTRLIERVRSGEATCVDGPPDFTNRIHADDAAAAVATLLQAPTAGPTYIGVDDEPADRCAVLTWLAQALGVTPPRVVPAGTDGPGRGGSKRCRNDLLRSMGWQPTYPSFREGYRALLDASG